LSAALTILGAGLACATDAAAEAGVASAEMTDGAVKARQRPNRPEINRPLLSQFRLVLEVLFMDLVS
jgi:hypothetical protein